MLNLKNEFIKILEDEICYQILDTKDRFITKWYKEDLEEDFEEELIKEFEEIIKIKDNEELIRKLQLLDSNLTYCYYDNAIEMYKNAYKKDIEESYMAQEMIDLLDEQKVEKYLLESECINKVGKYFIYYYC